MDPKKFGYSTLPLHHAPYGPITPEKLAGQNKGKVAVVTGAARVNNAGVSPNRPQWQERFEDFWRTIEINFKGAMLLTWEVLAGMRERKTGIIISLASRVATVDVPFGIGYCSSKAAVACAMSTLQEEIEFDGLGENIHFFALHPGGVPTAMAKGEFSPEMLERYPALAKPFDFDKLFVDGPELCGVTCAYLATGKAKEVRGLYLDCRQDIERLSAVGREQLLKDFHNTLTVNFIDGYKNEP